MALKYGALLAEADTIFGSNDFRCKFDFVTDPDTTFLIAAIDADGFDATVCLRATVLLAVPADIDPPAATDWAFFGGDPDKPAASSM